MKIQENFESGLSSLLFSKQEQIFFERKKLLQKITSNKFDKKNNENIKNVDLNKLLSFEYNYKVIDKNPTTHLIDNEYYQINIVNGVCQNFEDKNIKIVKITNNESSIFFENKFSFLDDLILDINSIFLNSGFILKIKNNSNVKIKIFNQAEKDTTNFQKNIIKCEKGSTVKILEEFNNSENSINNLLYSISAELDSKIEHTIIQDINKSDNLYLTTYTKCEKNSLYNQHIFNFSEGFVRNFHYADLIGTESNASLKGCFFIKDQNLSSIKTFINHKCENCKSNQVYKGVLNDNSRANYFSNTKVDKKAQKTEAYQLSKGILLSDSASFFSKPELRIFADDVKCSHGSTIGPIDQNALFYLRSRGINNLQALKMLISSLIYEDVEGLDDYASSRVLEGLENYLKDVQ